MVAVHLLATNLAARIALARKAGEMPELVVIWLEILMLESHLPGFVDRLRL